MPLTCLYIWFVLAHRYILVAVAGFASALFSTALSRLAASSWHFSPFSFSSYQSKEYISLFFNPGLQDLSLSKHVQISSRVRRLPNLRLNSQKLFRPSHAANNFRLIQKQRRKPSERRLGSTLVVNRWCLHAQPAVKSWR